MLNKYKKIVKKYLRKKLNNIGYDLVYYDKQPGSFKRYPYANFESFLADIKARGFTVKIAIDIGANKGDWSEAVANFYPDMRSILVEPQIEMLPKLEEAKKDRPWEIVLAGLAQKAELRKFAACSDTVSSSFLKDDDESNVKDIREVEVMTLNDLYKQYIGDEDIDLLKIDAEGLELEILRGGERALQKAHMVMLEVSFYEFNKGQPSFSEIVSEMNKNNFSIYDFVMFYRRPYDNALGLVDCVFVSDKCKLRSSHAWN